MNSTQACIPPCARRCADVREAGIQPPRRANALHHSRRDFVANADRRRRVLDRDSIWLTEKGDDGATSLYPLNGFRPAPRRDETLRRYLLGAYGGRPRIQPGALAREVEEALA